MPCADLESGGRLLMPAFSIDTASHKFKFNAGTNSFANCECILSPPCSLCSSDTPCNWTIVITGNTNACSACSGGHFPVNGTHILQASYSIETCSYSGIDCDWRAPIDCFFGGAQFCSAIALIHVSGGWKVLLAPGFCAVESGIIYAPDDICSQTTLSGSFGTTPCSPPLDGFCPSGGSFTLTKGP